VNGGVAGFVELFGIGSSVWIMVLR